MSANRDSSQNTTFIYSNLYEIYLKDKSRTDTSSGISKGVLLHSQPVRIQSESETRQIRSWTQQPTDEGKKNLASHLLELRNARKRLSFLMTEMDELLKRT